MHTLETLQAGMAPLPRHLGVELTSAAADRVTATLLVTEANCTSTNSVHGGALMAFADTLGAVATTMNLADGKWTTTLESKTNFLAPAPPGTVLTGETTPLHRGRRTQIWETTIRDEAGKIVAKITQTQLVL